MRRYEGGVSSYLEVLDAQRRQFDSSQHPGEHGRDELVSVVQLYKPLGGGWQQMEAATAAAPPAGGEAPAPPQQPTQ